MKAADIPDRAFVEAVRDVNRDRGTTMACWGYEGFAEPHLLERFPGVPEKVLLAKARKVLKRGLVTGCACGCRGDFEVTDKGHALLDEPWESVDRSLYGFSATLNGERIDPERISPAE